MLDKKEKIKLLLYVFYLLALAVLFVWFRQFFQLDPEGAYLVSLKNVVQYNISFFLALVTTICAPIVWREVKEFRQEQKELKKAQEKK